MKRHSTSLAIREMQIKTTMRYHFTLFRVANINKSTNKEYWRDWREKVTLVHCWWECRLEQPLWKTVWNFLRKLKMELSNTKNPETPIQKNLCTPMFIAVSFTVAKCWKQPKYPSVNQWIKKFCTYTQWNTTPQKERRNSCLL